MNDNQFNALLSLIVPQIIQRITDNSNVTEVQAIQKFYKSSVYKELSDESSKIWHYSPLVLYRMFQDELLTGKYDYPEEA